MRWHKKQDDRVVLAIKVRPNASINQVKILEDKCQISLKAAATEGKANQALIKFLAKRFKCTQKEVVILSGHTHREKHIQLPLTAEIKTFIEKE